MASSSTPAAPVTHLVKGKVEYYVANVNGCQVVRRINDNSIRIKTLLKAVGITADTQVSAVNRRFKGKTIVSTNQGFHGGTWLPVVDTRILAAEHGLTAQLRDLLADVVVNVSEPAEPPSPQSLQPAVVQTKMVKGASYYCCTVGEIEVARRGSDDAISLGKLIQLAGFRAHSKAYKREMASLPKMGDSIKGSGVPSGHWVSLPNAIKYTKKNDIYVVLSRLLASPVQIGIQSALPIEPTRETRAGGYYYICKVGDHDIVRRAYDDRVSGNKILIAAGVTHVNRRTEILNQFEDVISIIGGSIDCGSWIKLDDGRKLAIEFGLDIQLSKLLAPELGSDSDTSGGEPLDVFSTADFLHYHCKFKGKIIHRRASDDHINLTPLVIALGLGPDARLSVYGRYPEGKRVKKNTAYLFRGFWVPLQSFTDAASRYNLQGKLSNLLAPTVQAKLPPWYIPPPQTPATVYVVEDHTSQNFCVLVGTTSVARRPSDGRVNLTDMVYSVGDNKKQRRRETSYIKNVETVGSRSIRRGTWILVEDASEVAERYKLTSVLKNLLAPELMKEDPNKLPRMPTGPRPPPRRVTANDESNIIPSNFIKAGRNGMGLYTLDRMRRLSKSLDRYNFCLEAARAWSRETVSTQIKWQYIAAVYCRNDYNLEQAIATNGDYDIIHTMYPDIPWIEPPPFSTLALTYYDTGTV
ncbi:hypothetical protein M408DRAFT_22471 [Serendipita vermifera MAFF 305830]|uniref:HTH APSES-type domain-containing protein n=1 Tax=Serendipita vermifera MAFF 305830 TaxID=933852 RepID=A0A0C3AZW1_SERVB|nr:hypothetical protein M408DRAFT_22471 [Serendipita vermifera MAFF 305830]